MIFYLSKVLVSDLSDYSDINYNQIYFMNNNFSPFKQSVYQILVKNLILLDFLTLSDYWILFDNWRLSFHQMLSNY